ncbi:cytochrome b N-terminal domain-containing protein [Paradesulfitobacterium aromaticivorans]
MTGTLLLFYYEPGEKAFASLGVIANLTPYGNLIRGLHFWAAQIMVITVLLHMARVVWHQAYRPPREKNWVIGVALFCLTLILDFSGYLLRGSQESTAAATVARGLLENFPGGDVLARMFLGTELWQGSSLALYVWHVFLLAGFALFLQIGHFWRVRRDGGVRPL